MTAYTNTDVPVARSQEAIRELLQKNGVRGIQFTEDFETREINVRFAKLVEKQPRTVSVTMVVPEPPAAKRKAPRRIYRNGRYVEPKSSNQRQEQLVRATYRALHYWLKSQFEAIEFGLLSFEDVFLSHFEWMVDGQRMTVGQIVKPRLAIGGNLLGAPRSDVIDVE